MKLTLYNKKIIVLSLDSIFRRRNGNLSRSEPKKVWCSKNTQYV